ncbi:MAG: hypothetical protein ACOYMN_01260 [Roseimicrobium sp.]
MSGAFSIVPLVAHLALLALPSAWVLRRLRWPGAVAVPAVFLLVWSAVVLGGTILAAFDKLDSTKSFVTTTVLVGLAQSRLLLLLARYQKPEASAPWEPLAGEAEHWQRVLRRYVLLIFAVVLVVLTCNGYGHGPMVEDNLTCKLVRAHFFVQNGNFLPDPTNPDTRIFGVPPYVTLLQCLVLSHQAPLGCLNLLGTAAWVCLACGVYRLAGLCGATRLGALLSACALCFSSCLLLQGSSENDDILASLPSLWFFPFVIHSIRGRNVLSGYLAGLSFGLGVGAKLFPLLFGPMLLVGACWWLWRRQGWAMLRQSSALRTSLATMALAVVVTWVPFGYYNTLYTGSPLRLPALTTDIQNRPFSLETAAQNILAQTASAMTHGPAHLGAVLADRGFLTRSQWSSFVNAIEGAVSSAMSWNAKPFHDAWGEAFRLVPPAADGLPLQRLFGDTNTWFGFLPWLVIPAVLSGLIWRARSSWLLTLLPLMALCWFAAYCASNKFILDVGRYFLTPLSVAMPVVALFWDRHVVPGARRTAAWPVAGVFVLVGALNLVLAWPTVNEGRYRRLTDLSRRGNKPLPIEQTSRRLHDTIFKAKRVNVINNWQLPLFAVAVHLGEKGRMTVSAPFSADVPELVGFPSDYPTGLGKGWPWGLAGVPMDEQLPGGVGFMWLGRTLLGFELWGTGTPVLRKHTAAKQVWNCALFRLARVNKEPELTVTPFLRAESGLEFQAAAGSIERPSGVWTRSEARVPVSEETKTVSLFVRDPARPEVAYRKEVRIVGWQTYSLAPERVRLDPR